MFHYTWQVQSLASGHGSFSSISHTPSFESARESVQLMSSRTNLLTSCNSSAGLADSVLSVGERAIANHHHTKELTHFLQQQVLVSH